MSKRALYQILAVTLIGAVAACSGPQHTPNAGQTTTIDSDGYAPKVEAFAVILDVSSSMGEEYQGRPKMHAAQDLVASFNAAVPPLDFKSGLVTFGRTGESCIGKGMANTAYGLTNHSTSDFASALGSITCAGGTTPMSAGIDATTSLLSNQSGPVAVVLVSDFKWVDEGLVRNSVQALKAQHGNNLCLHTVKIGDDPGAEDLIADITSNSGCDSANSGDSLTSPSAMSAYVIDVLLAPLQYEKYEVSAQALFDFDKYDLKPEGMAELRNLADYIKSQGNAVADINVVGHTDSMGSEEYNQGLSERRAAAVTEFLISEGVKGGLIDTMGRGELEPVDTNETEAGRARNRRVEVHVGGSRRAGG